ncbi:MAG TPA: 1-phosphofructokinase family hexose kinase [Gemmatimonadales bacterium]|nr:1-phosphofructokinase family hexose kinase [Gemmatimonadales bacterium]
MPSRPYPAIAILALNPSLDVSYEVPQLIPDQKARATLTRYDPGGNGINAGRTLKSLGVRAECFCLVAGEIGLFLQRALEQELDSLRCVDVPGETRVNCTLIQAQPRVQYEVVAAGPTVPTAALEAVATGFLQAAGQGFGVLTGSLPPGVPDETYASLARRLRDNGARAVVDAQPAVLKPALAARPFLIKPNRYELETLCRARLPTRDRVLRMARDVQRAGINWVCVSLGGEGAVLVGEDEAYYAAAPPITVRSTVGAGDAMLAGLVAGFARAEEPAAALRLGVACGSATAEKAGTMLCTADDVARLGAAIEVHQIHE